MRASSGLRELLILGRALELDEGQRRAFIERECGADHALLERVQRLLEADASEHGMLDERPEIPVSALLDDEARKLAAGDCIGAFRIVEELGSGGMGTVYVAEQHRPRRRVALKTLRQGLTSGARRRRFLLEAEVLGSLQHPAIAHVYGSGVHEDEGGSTPFFAMELVENPRDLLTYAKEQHLDDRARIELFLVVCEAVQHGHQRGVIHRDLKPGNILVDGDGRAKVIDFGLARVTDPERSARTMTETGAVSVLGTLAYAAPERLCADASEPDLREDVYSLGIVLYELMAERLPFDVDGALADTVRTIVEGELVGLGTVRPSLGGELEWICASATHLDAEQRYPSVSELAADLRRFLAGDAVSVGPPTWSYRLRTTVRRYRWPLAGAVVLLVMLAAATFVSVRQRIQAERERALAIEARDEARAVTSFLTSMIGTASPFEYEQDPTVRAFLDVAAPRVDAEFADRPLVRAAVEHAIGEAYLQLGRYPDAERHLARAIAARTSALGTGDPLTLESRYRRGALLRLQGRGLQADEALSTLLDDSRAALGQDAPATLTYQFELAALLGESGRLEEAERLVLDALARTSATSDSDDPVYIRGTYELGRVRSRQERYEEATELLEAAHGAYVRTRGENHPLTRRALGALATCYRHMGRLEAVEPLYRTLLISSEQQLGEEHPVTLEHRFGLAGLLGELGRWSESEKLLVRTLEESGRILGPDHHQTLTIRRGLSSLLLAAERFEEAEPLLRADLEDSERLYGPDHEATLASLTSFGWLLHRQGKLDEAIEVLTHATDTLERVVGPDMRRTLLASNELALTLSDAGRLDEAIARHESIVAAHERGVGQTHPDTLTSRYNLASALIRAGQLERAEEILADVVAAAGSALPRDHPAVGVYAGRWGRVLAQLGRTEEAEAVLLDAHRRVETAFGAGSSRSRSLLGWLADLCDATGRAEEAAAWRARITGGD